MPESSNPLLSPWETPFGLPPFEKIETGDFAAAFGQAMTIDRAEVDAIAGDPAPPTFENTIAALERSGRDLRRVAMVFFNLCGAHTDDDLQRIEREVAPKLATHRTQTLLNRDLFARINNLWNQREQLALSAEQARVLERYFSLFTRAGAGLDDSDQDRMAAINERLAELQTRFGQNVLADESGFELILDTEGELAGLPDFVVAAARQAAHERGHPGKAAITLSRSLIEPFLQFSARRDLRQAAYRAWTGRGEKDGETDNRPLLAEILRLRAQKAALLKFDDFASFKTDDTMSQTPAAVRSLLRSVWAPARAKALAERQELAERARDEGINSDIEPWDWRYFAEKRRQARFQVDEAEIKPYFQLDRMIAAAFETARRLFGLRFRELDGLNLYHSQVRAFEVTDPAGKHVGVFLGDYFARPSKRSGAWMSAFRSQENFDGPVRPLILNVMNFAQAPEGEPTLLTFDDARTLFHEFGHALHGLMSDVAYPMISGTSVSRDFVELPSQLFEHWLSEPAILREFAIHHRTGDPIPEPLLERLLAAENANSGFATVEYVSSALADLELHESAGAADRDPTDFEADFLARIEMPGGIGMRHRIPHFAHIFSGDGYSAGYYSYMWSEVLDADAFEAFSETGDPFDAEIAARLADTIYSAGGRQDAKDAYREFRGRLPDIGPLLKKKGFASNGLADA